MIIGTSEPVDHCMPEFKRPNCLLQVWQDLQEFDIQSCPSSSPGADPTGLPPAYLSVPNHQDCLGLEDFGSHTKLCLPSSKPSGCLDASWEALNEVFEDKCSQLHNCAARVMGIQSHARESVIKPPSYDPRDIVALVEKYGDAHISDSGWRAVDPEECYADD